MVFLVFFLICLSSYLQSLVSVMQHGVVELQYSKLYWQLLPL